jgi:hypothetical protein
MDDKCDGGFPYCPVTSSDMVRLLQVSRGKDASITGKLENFSLDAPPTSGYTTLSYVWGERRYHPSKIILDGHSFPVLESIYPVLEAICDNPKLANENSWWWIDSICINQGNDGGAMSERSSQISMMGRIYKQSERTVVWLGEGTKENEDAMEFLDVLAKSIIKLKQKFEVPELQDLAKWKSLEALLLRPWWTRVWTLQEFVVAHKLIFYYGPKSIERNRFRTAIRSLGYCRAANASPIKPEAFHPAWNRRRLVQWYEAGKGSSNGMGLIALMAYMGDCQAADDRDRIYSLLGLAKDRELASRLNYESSVENMYVKLVQSFVETYKSLDIICFAHLFNRRAVKSASHSALPSWVPDWRVHVEPFVVPLMASQSAQAHIGNFRPVINPAIRERSDTLYAAAAKSPPEIAFSDDFQVLTCKAILIDHIDGLGGTSVTHRGYVQSTSPINIPVKMEVKSEPVYSIQRDLDQIFNLMDDVTRSLVLDREDRYLSHPAPLGRFRKEFRDLCTAAIDEPKRVHPWFRNWFELNKSLYVRGYTLETLMEALCETDAKVLVPPKMTNLMGASETSFVSRLQDTKGGSRMARVLVTTDDGYVGMASHRTRKGDLICVLLGCNIPVVLRKRKEDKQSEELVEESYEFVGECYLHGFMNGEALSCGKFKTEDLRLS